MNAALDPGTPASAPATPGASALATPSPVRRSLLRDQVRLELIDRIVRGALVPGDRLNEAALAAELQISRTPLKEAILAMERDGFVQASRSRGHVVTPLSLREIEEVYPILMSYEALILARYPPSGATLDRMQAINAEFASAEDAQARLRLDNAFHAALASGCPNGRLVDAAQSLELVVRRYHVRYPYRTLSPEQSARDHQAIVDAARRGDTVAALAAVESHWNYALGRLVEAIRTDPPDAPPAGAPQTPLT
ncbi:MAG: GntR family transcriptional regulator [Actinobacteria bacterium]|nr:GntR family transcriptional regulator [Actinomycetota bacterium]